MKKKQTCLVVTGGSGFIGTHLIHYFLSRSRFDSYVILDLVAPRIADKKITFVQCDIRQAIPQIKAIPSADRILCIHLAALCKEPGYAWDEYFQTNYVGTQNLIAFLERSRVHELIFTSTEMVYRAQEASMGEESLTAPDTAYGISKLLAEKILLSWAAADRKRRLRIARPAVVFGKWEGGNYSRLYRALRRNAFAYVGRKSTVKSSIYVKDLVRFLEFLISENAKHTVYNAAFPERLTMKGICDEFCRVFGWKRFIPTIPYQFALGIATVVHSGLLLLGIDTPIHPRRIQKLFHSSDILSLRALDSGFEFEYSLRTALEDWKRDCGSRSLY